MSMKYDIVIIGAGVSGLIAAYTIAKNTSYTVAIIEKGTNYSDRFENVKMDASVHLKGVGGAGTLMGGKLCLPPASSYIWEKTEFSFSKWNAFVNNLPINESLKKKIADPKGLYGVYDQEFRYIHKQYKSILLLKDDMCEFINSMISAVKNLGIKIFPETTVSKITYQKSKYILYTGSDMIFDATKVIFAGGRESSLACENLFKNLNLKITDQSPDLGIRITFPHKFSESYSAIGKDVKIKSIYKDHNVRTFCVCSGGVASEIVLSDQKYYDGHFSEKITDQISLGIMSRSKAIVGVNEALNYCRSITTSGAISVKEYLSSYSKLSVNRKFTGVFESINTFISDSIRYGYFDGNLSEYKVNLPSIDHYSPIIETNGNFETNHKGLYIIGDATGISRGYMQSLWSGWITALSVSNIGQNKDIVYKSIKDVKFG